MKLRNALGALIGVIILINQNAFATNMKAPITLPSAKVLPKGVRNFNLKGVITSSEEKFNGAGFERPLADPMFQNITFGDLILGKKDPVDKAAIEAKMVAIGADENTILGSTQGQVNLKPTVTVPVIAYGVTDRWTTAIAIPIMKYDLNVDSGVTQSNVEMINALNQRLEADELWKDKEEFNRKFSAPLEAKLEDYGYKPLVNENATKLGDIKLVNKYKTFDNGFQALTASLELTLPTGQKADIDKIVDIPGGDGQTDIGVGINHDIYIGQYVTFSTGLSYTAQLADTVERRVPEQRKSTVSEEKDNNIQRDLGDILTAQAGAGINYRGVSFGAGYTLGYKDGDKYTGSKYESNRYEWLGKDSIQNMQALTGKIGYDTITLFKEKKFPAPLAVSITYTTLLSGKNMVKDPLTVLDFNMFF